MGCHAFARMNEGAHMNGTQATTSSDVVSTMTNVRWRIIFLILGTVAIN
jgi:hypothetical protein